MQIPIERYEIRRKLGAGGMGEVYLAHDTQLNRPVALKILSKEFSEDEVRRQRFKLEARAVSALNHPNIITIYEIGESELGWFIAHEYVEGDTLRQYLKESPLTILQAVRFAEQIAQALCAAHEAGIIHRDIKPENIMIRRDGYVKVLDFGLAKTTESPGAEAESTTSQIANTIPGMVMGSVRYMSPEQARGLAVDPQTDIWSLGVCFYEMLTGQPPFRGETTSDTLAAVIHLEPPPLRQLVPNAPVELQRIVRKALQKERTERYQSIKELALDLKNALYEVEHEISLENHLQTRSNPDISENPTVIHQSLNNGQTISGAARQTHLSENPTLSRTDRSFKQVKSRKLGALAALMIGLGLLTALVAGYYFRLGTKTITANSMFEKIQVTRLESDGKVRLPTISPDGKYIAYSSGDLGNRSLVIRQISTNNIITLVPTTSLDFNAISFSPGGDYVYYTQMRKDFSVNTLYRVSTFGGTAKMLVDDVDSPVTFSPDGQRMAFQRHASTNNSDTIFIANADGSNLQPLVNTEQTEFSALADPVWSPDGTKLVAAARNKSGGMNKNWFLVEISTNEGKIQPIGEQKWKEFSNFCWLRDGSGLLLAGQETEQSFNQIWRINYPDGEIKPITNDSNDYFTVSVSDDSGTVTALKGDASYGLWTYNPASKEMKQLIQERRNLFWDTRFSQLPDGRLLFSRRENNQINFWSVNPDGTNEQQLFTDTQAAGNPIVTKDGRYIVFASRKSGNHRIWRMDVDGKNPVQISEGGKQEEHFNPQVTPDGRAVIFQDSDQESEISSINHVSIDGGAITFLLRETNFSNFSPRLSPDGKYLAFISFNRANFERHWRIAPLRENSLGAIERSWEYSLIDNFGWSPDSQTLTYLSRDGVPNLYLQPFLKFNKSGGAKPEPLTEFKNGRIFNFTWSRDGKEIFLVRGLVNNELVLIRNNPKGS